MKIADRVTVRILLMIALMAPVMADADNVPEDEEAIHSASAVVEIPISEITAEAGHTVRTLRELAGTLSESRLYSEVSEALPGVTETIDRQAARADETIEGASLKTLNGLRSEWTSLAGALRDWRKALALRSAEVGAAIDKLDTLNQIWTLTSEVAKEKGASQVIVDRILVVLGKIEETRDSAGARQTKLFTLQTAVAAQSSRTDGALALLEDLRQQVIRRIFERNGAPIWAPQLLAQLADQVDGSRVRTTAVAEIAKLRNFVTRQWGGLLFQAGFFALLLFLLFSARRRVRRRTDDEVGLAEVADVFELPISIALLIAISSSFWLFPHIPQAVGQILGAVALVPTVLLLRRFTAKALYPLLNALVIFYFIDRLRQLALVLPTLSRAIYLLEMIGGIVFLIWLLRPARISRIPNAIAGTWTLRAIGLAMRVALALFLASLFADATGYSQLGRLLGNSVLESAYVGIVASAAVQIFDSLVTFLLRVRPLGSLRLVRRSRHAIRRRIHHVIVVVSTGFWVLVTLDLLTIRRPLQSALHSMLTAQLEAGSIALSIGDVAAFVLTIWLAFQISRFVRFVLEEDVYPRLSLSRGVPYAASTLTHYGILLLGFFLAVAATDVDLDRFAFVAGAFGVGIGFGLQNVVNNFVSGLILLSERPVQVGDTIEAGNALGEVKRIGIRSSTVRTWDGAELIVPNSELVSERVINWTLSDRQRRMTVPVGVAYGTDRRLVLELLRQVAVDNEDVLEHPAPAPLFRGFGDSSLDFELRAWTDSLEKFIQVQSDLSVAISYALDEAGIEVPFPQRDLHLRSIDEGAIRGLRPSGDEG